MYLHVCMYGSTYKIQYAVQLCTDLKEKNQIYNVRGSYRSLCFFVNTCTKNNKKNILKQI